MSDLKQYDPWLTDDGPAALVLREPLEPVEGPDGVLFPPTFAAEDEEPGGYNIDVFSDGSNVCLVDSVGSQANRIEPLFANPGYSGLVPQVVITAGGRRINLLDAGHRAGDALVRCSSLQPAMQAAFRSLLTGDAGPLAEVAPTSLVFGVWDSRGTQAKLPRLVSSTIRAFKVRRLTRSANYLVQQQVDYARDGIVPEWDDLTAAQKKDLSKKGYQNALATGTHGGVIADGGVRRDATLSLVALRLLAAGPDRERTLALRRYILGLALVALTAPPAVFLRQGCQLVRAGEIDFKLVYADGRREAAGVDHESALAFARLAAAAFGVGNDREVPFEKERAVKDVKGEAADGETKPKKKAK